MTILYITPSDPAQSPNGSAQRSRLLHEALSKLGTVYTVIPTMLRRREYEDRERRVRCVCVERRYGPKWVLKHLLKRLFPLIVLPLYASAALAKLYPDVKFDCVVVRYAEWAAYYTPWQIAPVILDLDDDPVEVYRTVCWPHACRLTRSLKARLIRRWRNWVLNHCHGIWIANDSTLNDLPARHVAHLSNIALPPGAAYQPYGRQENLLVSIGCLGYAPHRDGLNYFIKTYWPTLRRAFPALRLVIAGQDCPTRLAKQWQSLAGIDVLGYVEDLTDLYARSLLTLAPVYGGSGTSIKVIESLLYERHCLVTDFAVRGWPPEAVTPENGLIRLSDPDTLPTTLRPLLQTIQNTPNYGKPFAALASRRFSHEAFQKSVSEMVAWVVSREW